jgi:shikimate dehydrogenase
MLDVGTCDARRLGADVVRVSLGAPSAEVLDARLRLLDAAGCRAELRLDLLPSAVDLGRLVRAFPGLDLLAAWPRRGSSTSARDADARRVSALREAAEAGMPWIDVPLELASADLPPSRRVWSWHAVEGGGETGESGHGVPQDPGAAAARAWEALQDVVGPEDVAKLVGWADCAREGFEVLDLAAAAGDPRLLAFAMGPGGEASRLLTLRHGAPWTYAGWRGAPTAQGQSDWQDVLELLPDADRGPICGVAGDPVAHSWSPQLWRAAWAACGAGRGAGWFVRFRVLDFPRFLARAKRYGVDLLAVTAPFKEAALVAADVADDTARRCGAANLLLRGTGREAADVWSAGNTDGVGAMEALAEAGMPEEAALLVLGAGGAARAAAAEGLRRGHRVTVAARRAEAQLEVARRLDRMGPLATSSLPLKPDALTSRTPAGASLAVVQATPLGSSGRPGDPLEGVDIPRDTRVLEMVYAPPRTTLLARAEAAGAVAVSGRAMLLHQMRAQYARLHGEPAPLAPLARRLAAESSRRAGIVLLGMRGAGKSTLGRWLADVLGLPFVDADQAFLERTGMSVAVALASDQPSFRERESALLLELLDAQEDAGGGVLASGGGAVLHPASRVRLHAHPGTVLLDAPADVLAARQAAAPRPALTDAPALLDEVRELLQERADAYAACARGTVKTDGDLDVTRAGLLAWARTSAHTGFPS